MSDKQYIRELLDENDTLARAYETQRAISACAQDIYRLLYECLMIYNESQVPVSMPDNGMTIADIQEHIIKPLEVWRDELQRQKSLRTNLHMVEHVPVGTDGS